MPRQATPQTDTQIKSIKPKSERYRVSDTGGLMLEVMSVGSKIWRYRYQLHGMRQPSLTIGNYTEITWLKHASVVMNGLLTPSRMA
jgi:hypothetical protein